MGAVEASTEHPDLKDNIWVNINETPGNGIDDDGNGYIDDVFGYDFAGTCDNDFPTAGCGPRPSPQDVHSHGSHCAGIVAAVRRNGVGISGVAPNVRIMCLK
ncbi:Thermophilic serine proteinase, partial [Tetrabaena socialis]